MYVYIYINIHIHVHTYIYIARPCSVQGPSGGVPHSTCEGLEYVYVCMYLYISDLMVGSGWAKSMSPQGTRTTLALFCAGTYRYVCMYVCIYIYIFIYIYIYI